MEEWVTAHIIPVRPAIAEIERLPHNLRSISQQSPISLSSRSYPTLLLGKSISFTPVGSDTETPEWNRVLLDDKIRIIGMKEVCDISLFLSLMLNNLVQASNGVLYIIDGTISVS